MKRPAAIIQEALAPGEITMAHDLIRRYAAWLAIDLDFQDLDTELAKLPGVYARPEGRLLLALAGDAAIGCVGLRRLTEGTGEVKRLYVSPEHRGGGIGRRLMETLIHEARAIGYRRLRLDTLPRMDAARRLYVSLGFRITGPYYATPLEGTVFMEIILDATDAETHT